nr:hypothetical protein [Dactylosporangium matsuzakiense]
MLAFLDREVVDTEHLGRLERAFWDAADDPQQRHPVDRDVERVGHPRARPAAQGQRDGLQDAAGELVRRAYRGASPLCSAYIFRSQLASVQKNRRTTSRISTRRPAIARSASRRRYRLCTRLDALRQLGHDTADATHRAST